MMFLRKNVLTFQFRDVIMPFGKDYEGVFMVRKEGLYFWQRDRSLALQSASKRV